MSPQIINPADDVFRSIEPTLRASTFDWAEDDGNQEVFLLRHAFPSAQRKAAYADIVSFPVTEHGYTVLGELIDTLQSMQMYLEERIAPTGEIGYNVYKRNEEVNERTRYSDDRQRHEELGQANRGCIEAEEYTQGCSTR